MSHNRGKGCTIKVSIFIFTNSSKGHIIGLLRFIKRTHNFYSTDLFTSQNIYVEEDKLVELLETLKKVSDNFTMAKELLPPTQGFFFGSDEVDEYYKEDVNSTIKIIEELLKEHEQSKEYGLYSGDFEYRASW